MNSYLPISIAVAILLISLYLYFSWSVVINESVNTDDNLKNITHALCSFPPNWIFILEKLPKHIKLILNIGHRIHIHMSPEQLFTSTQKYIELFNSGRLILASMSEYDYHYTRYYTGISDIVKLPVISTHLPEKIRTRISSPSSQTILIGPTHNNNFYLEPGLEELNRMSNDYAISKGYIPYKFSFIKDQYPNNTASLENISKHPAVIILPYSAFSISMVEIYHSNIPFFVPCDELLIDKMDDVRIFPLYVKSKDEVKKLENDLVNLNYQYSPNCESVEAQKYWMKFMFFNVVKNAQRFKNINDLIIMIYETDLKKVSESMLSENLELFDKQKNNWYQIFN
jgi:hypothetical protein